MKKIFLLSFIVLFFGFLLAFSKKEKSYLDEFFNSDEVEYIVDNNISFYDIKPFLIFDTFDIYKYFDYEFYLKEGYNHYEAINLVNDGFYYSSYKNIKEAYLINTYLVLVNKHFYLEKNYIPNELDNLSNYNINYIKRENEIMQADKTSLINLEKLFEKAFSNGINLCVYSSYRTYDKQEYLYYVVNLENDQTVSRPGHSEHQTGLSFDISDKESGLTTHFENTVNYKWLESNAHLYGFIQRYPKTKTNFTLYSFEPWHYRYVGESVATYIYENNLTLEEYILKNYEIQ